MKMIYNMAYEIIFTKLINKKNLKIIIK